MHHMRAADAKAHETQVRGNGPNICPKTAARKFARHTDILTYQCHRRRPHHTCIPSPMRERARQNTHTLDVSTETFKQSITWPCQSVMQYQCFQNRLSMRHPGIPLCMSAPPLRRSIVNPIRAGSTRSCLEMPRNFIPARVRGMVVGLVERTGEAQPISPN